MKFGHLILRKIFRFIATMSDFKAHSYTPNSISAGSRPQTPLGELTALPQTPWLALRGLLLREGRKKGGE